MVDVVLLVHVDASLVLTTNRRYGRSIAEGLERTAPMVREWGPGGWPEGNLSHECSMAGAGCRTREGPWAW